VVSLGARPYTWLAKQTNFHSISSVRRKTHSGKKCLITGFASVSAVPGTMEPTDAPRIDGIHPVNTSLKTDLTGKIFEFSL
jgi:hypothetical protein